MKNTTYTTTNRLMTLAKGKCNCGKCLAATETKANTDILISERVTDISDMSEVSKGEVYDLLYEYKHNPDAYGVDAIINTWKENKRELWSLLEGHPTFNRGQIRIPVVERIEADVNAAIRMIDSIIDTFYHEIFVKYHLSVDRRLLHFRTIMLELGSEPNLTKEAAEKANAYCEEHYINLKFGEGMKMSRALNKLCDKFHIKTLYNKYKGEYMKTFDQKFAQIADLCRGKEIKHTLILSINPIDYLTMSFGNSWSSCHTIDPNDLRRKGGSNYSGCYMSGTLSYMLDKVSMVGYWIDEKKANPALNPETEDKVIRCMFHFDPKTGILVQGRIYPRDQNNQGCKDLYDELRHKVQNTLADLMGIESKWVLVKRENKREYISTVGYSTHYRDYIEYPNPSVSYIKPIYEPGNIIKIGHAPICPNCGEEHKRNDALLCYDCDCNVCRNCGETLHEDNTGYVSGDVRYCIDCSTYCSFCGDCADPLSNDYTTIDDETTVCPYCLQQEIDNGNVMWCDYHEQYESTPYDSAYVGNYGYVCDYGLSELESGDYVFYCNYHEQYEYNWFSDERKGIEGYGEVCTKGLDELINNVEVFYCEYHECYEYIPNSDIYDIEGYGKVCHIGRGVLERRGVTIS